MAGTELESKGPDLRPLLAVAHVELHVRNVVQTGEFLVRLGARPTPCARISPSSSCAAGRTSW